MGRNSPPNEEDLDPVAGRAATLKDQKLEKLQYFSDVEACKLAWKALALADERGVVFVESPTSKPRVTLRQLDIVNEVLQARPLVRTCILVPCARRFDLVVAAQNKLMILWPTWAHYTIQLNQGETQSLRKKPACLQAGRAYSFSLSLSYSFAQACLSKGFVDGDLVPASIRMRDFAESSECTRLRCMDKDCPLRPQSD